MSEKISSGSYDLNKFLYGGYEKEIITTIYGPAGSGKTNFCMCAVVSQAKKSNKVFYIDTEGGFSVDRFKQIAGENYKEYLENVLILKPNSFTEQKQNFNTLLTEINKNKIGLIVIDSLTMLYRLELGEAFQEKDDSKIKLVNKELAKQLRCLVEISRNKQIPIIVTNQVYYDFISNEDFANGKEKTANMVGGDLLKYWSKCLIELQNSGGKRKAILKKHRSLPEKEFHFTISNQGIKKRGFLI